MSVAGRSYGGATGRRQRRVRVAVRWAQRHSLGLLAALARDGIVCGGGSCMAYGPYPSDVVEEVVEARFARERLDVDGLFGEMEAKLAKMEAVLGKVGIVAEEMRQFRSSIVGQEPELDLKQVRVGDDSVGLERDEDGLDNQEEVGAAERPPEEVQSSLATVPGMFVPDSVQMGTYCKEQLKKDVTDKAMRKIRELGPDRAGDSMYAASRFAPLPFFTMADIVDYEQCSWDSWDLVNGLDDEGEEAEYEGRYSG